MSRAIRLLTEYAGPTDDVSEVWPFDSTDYYELEMGENLKRRFVSFRELASPDALAATKTLTNDLEKRITRDCGFADTQRLVNLDPGYLTLSKFVLATTKDFAHRVYVRDGIYA